MRAVMALWKQVRPLKRLRRSRPAIDDAAERFSAYYGRWVGSLNRCEPTTMQETAAAFLRETEHRPRSPEAGVAHRISGLTSLYFGDYAEARERSRKPSMFSIANEIAISLSVSARTRSPQR